MLEPQWHTKTPTRGSSPRTSRSAGYSFSATRVPRESASLVMAMAAVAEACATESGMSLGSLKGPTTSTPSRDVSSGRYSSSWQKPCRLRAMPSLPATSWALRAGSRPTESTTRSYSAVRSSPCSSSSVM